MTTTLGPTIPEIQANYDQLKENLVLTPVVRLKTTSFKLNYPEKTEVYLKLECFQHTGSFKARGALTTVAKTPKQTLSSGIVAVSAGNHGAATAFAASRQGHRSLVFMMQPANPFRVNLCKSFGADVRVVPTGAHPFKEAQKYIQENGGFLMHPFEGELIALGTGSLGLEMLNQAPDLDVLVVSIGGGGLAGGFSAAAKQINPKLEIYGVEPFGADSMFKSFEAGKPVAIEKINTIADSLGAPNAEPYSYSLCRRYIDEVVRVTDDQICEAIYQLFVDQKIAVEPAGAAALAAINGPLFPKIAGKKVGVVVCGANIDPDNFNKYLQRGMNPNIS
jgi:threonine dehydratase